MSKTDYAREIVKKYTDIALENKMQFTKTWLAGILYSEHINEFKSVEDARDYIRLVTHCKTIKVLKDQDIARKFALIPGAISEVTTMEPFIASTDIKKTLWIADIHGKFYDKSALELAINYGVKKGCDSCIILGDYMDFYGDSKFDKDPMVEEQIRDEQEWGQDTLEMLQNLFGYVVLKEGNHDERREKCIGRMAMKKPELMKLASYKDYLSFPGCKVNFVEAYRHIDYGQLSAIHGHEYNSGGIHIAYNRYYKTMDNIISAHSHTSQHTTHKNIHGQYYGSWTLGCLCQLSPRYAPKNRWNHGFAITEKDSSGDFDVDNRLIDGNKTRST